MTPRPRAEYAKTAARRRQIVDAAVDVFSGAGFRHGSLRDVAERVGLSQAGLLHHYPSKEHLLEAVLTWRDHNTEALFFDQRASGLDQMRGMVELVEHNERTPGLVELHVVLSAEATSIDHPGHDYFVRRYAYVQVYFRNALEKAAAEGHLKPDIDVASTARSIIALMDGLQVQWLLDRDSVNMANEVRRYLRSLLLVEL